MVSAKTTASLFDVARPVIKLQWAQCKSVAKACMLRVLIC